MRGLELVEHRVAHRGTVDCIEAYWARCTSSLVPIALEWCTIARRRSVGTTTYAAMEWSMPFDGAEFLCEPAARLSSQGAWHSRFAAKLRRILRARLRRSAPEPIDAAVLRVLEEARGLIEQREDWTQGTL